MQGDEAIRLFSIKSTYIVKISFAGPHGSDRSRLQPALPAVAGFLLLLIGRLTPVLALVGSGPEAVVLVVLGHILVFRSTQ
jgi:hypothetical protein